MRAIQLQKIELPTFGQCEELPEIPPAQFELRFQHTVEKMHEHNLDFLLVFADREHGANLTFLTNLDPRFEEALLLLDKNGKRKLLLGNECMGYTGICPIDMEYELYQEFSLMGQDRSLSKPLAAILTHFGIVAGARIGCSYYKYSAYDKQMLDIPAYLADLLYAITGKREQVVNAGDIFMDVETGLRHRTCLEELVRFEWASTRTSDSLKNVLLHIKPGIREYELARNFVSDGLPYSCHPMVSSGKKAAMGLSSPSANKVKLLDPFTSALGVWGALTARAGMVAEHASQLEQSVGDFYEVFWKAYFKTVVTWYESIGIGVTAGEVTEKVEEARNKEVFHFAVNTGHTLHLDEWVNSPFYKGSTIKLYSGMALQMDIIPVSKKAFVCANMEDGIVLADETLRNEWATHFPASWKRIEQRRDFMIQEIGINIKPEVLPLSNIPAYFTPYLMSKDRVAVIK
jgi:hypothetical protein